MNARSASALVAAALLSVACAAPAAFARRNGDIVYSMHRPGSAFDLYASPPGGGSARRLTRTPESDELDPEASPGGRLIAYTRVLLAHRGSRIWIARRDGSHRRFVARGSEPAWSPDGKRIVFVGPRRPPEKPEIYTMRADGTHLRRLTRNAGASDRSPAWSPDGKRIVFERSWGRFPQSHVFVMNADGSDQHQAGTLVGSMPTWSPDGRQIAYVSGNAIFRANADGSDVRRVARGGRGFTLAFRSGIDWRVR